MPIDCDPIDREDAESDWLLVDEHGRIGKPEAFPPGVELFVSHFATCPDSERHRRSKPRREKQRAAGE